MNNPFENILLLNLIKYMLHPYRDVYINENCTLLQPILKHNSFIYGYTDMSISNSRDIIFFRPNYRISMESNGDIMLSFFKDETATGTNIYVKYNHIKERYVLESNSNHKLTIYKSHEIKFIKKVIYGLKNTDPIVYLLDVYMNKI